MMGVIKESSVRVNLLKVEVIEGKDMKMSKTTKIYLWLAIAATVVFGAFAATRIVAAIKFEINCGAFMSRAAEANTIELASTNLAKAIAYAEENDLTEGIVSIFLQNPNNDIGFWYNNMRYGYEEMIGLPEDASALERTNLLMKLRESLTDNEGTILTPQGIEIYPHNKVFFWWATLSTVAASVFWLIWGIRLEKENADSKNDAEKKASGKKKS